MKGSVTRGFFASHSFDLGVFVGVVVVHRNEGSVSAAVD